MAQADKEILVTYNAVDKSTPPTFKKHSVSSLDEEDVRYVLECVKNEPLKWQVVINLLAFTCACKGEIAGIKINKINFKENTIHFAHSLLYSSELGIYQSSLKTEASDRILELPAELMKLIKKLMN